jgi:virginiamycin B lyase
VMVMVSLPAIAAFVGQGVADAQGAGTVTIYNDPSISTPLGITAGPDGALWFTNFGNLSIGRITTSGVVTNYTGPDTSGAGGITTGPDGAL